MAVFLVSCRPLQPLFTEDTGEPFTVLHSVSHVQAGVHTMEVLLLRIQKDPQETKGSGYSVSLEWITVANTAGQGGCCAAPLLVCSWIRDKT